MLDKPCFVIGDVHGHDDRLFSLLSKIGATNLLDGPRDYEIIQLGDLGHFGPDTKDGDWDCYDIARRFVDVVLWGNHDRAVVDAHHRFSGYMYPGAEMAGVVKRTCSSLAAARHGYLLTHAGLHPAYYSAVDHVLIDVANVARFVNGCGEDSGVVKDISYNRGGNRPQGGVLWRDYREDVVPIKQIYGHSRGNDIRKKGETYCIDVGDKGMIGNLAGIWLPEMRVVAVGPDADRLEKEVWDE